MIKIDAIDKKISDLLLEDGRMSCSAIAARRSAVTAPRGAFTRRASPSAVNVTPRPASSAHNSPAVIAQIPRGPGLFRQAIG